MFLGLRAGLDKEFADLIDKMIESAGAAEPYDLAGEWRMGVHACNRWGSNANTRIIKLVEQTPLRIAFLRHSPKLWASAIRKFGTSARETTLGR